MKKLIFRNFILDICTFFVISSLSLALIVWVIQSVNYLDLVSEDGHSLKVYFMYTLYTFPKIISRVIMFSFFISIFFIILKYEENNEILIYWIHGVKKIAFINNLLKFTFVVLILQLLLNIYIVPVTLDKARSHLRESNIDYFPSLIKSKLFIDAVSGLTIFIEKKKSNGELENIFLKDKLNDNGSQIISSKKGKIIKKNEKYFLILDDGKIVNIDGKNLTHIKFQKTEFNLSKYSTKTIVVPKIQEIKTSELINCIYNLEKDNAVIISKNFQCNEQHIDNVIQEVSKRIIRPIYILILTLITSFLILKSKDESNNNTFKFILFLLGIVCLTLSEATSIFISFDSFNKIIYFLLPFILFLIIYIFLSIKLSSTKLKHI